MAIPSLAMRPSAEAANKLYSVLPNNGDGDFQFNRDSSATLINSKGLIQTVGYFSDEIVQNGNFSEIGSELVVNGNFDNGSTSWTLVGDVSIGNGVCTFFDTGSNANSRLIQTGITANKTYKVVFSVTRYVAGRVQLIFGGGSSVNVDISAGVGTYTAYVTAGGSTQWEIKRDGGVPNFDFDIDNVSVKQVDPNDNWTVINGSISDIYNASMTAYQSGIRITPFSYTGTFKVVFDLVVTSGSCKFDAGGGNDQIYTTSGTKEKIITNPTKFEFNAFNLGWVGTLNNVSVKQILGDRPRFNYEINNGIVESCPSFLLEPTSTNLIIYSSDFSQSVWNKQSGVTATYNTTETLSPDGTYNATKLIGNGTTGIFTSVTVSGVVSRSIYIKSVTGNVNVILKDPQNTVTQKTLNVTTQWQRFELVEDNTISSQGLWVDDIPSSGIYIYGAQLEQQSYATSLIPTAGIIKTRAAETCFGAGTAATFSDSEGVLYAEVATLVEGGSNRYLGLSDGSSDNRVVILYTNTADKIRAILSSGGTKYVDETVDVSSTTDFNKVAIKYKANDFALWINGVEVATDTSLSAPVGLDRFDFLLAGANNFYGKVKDIRVYNEALTDAQLQTLTTL